MTVPGRNDPCPCGSGKKYKKCCTPKYDKPSPAPALPSWTRAPKASSRPDGSLSFSDGPMLPDYLDPKTDEEILAWLKEFGVETNREAFVSELKETLDPSKIMDRWRRQLDEEQQYEAGDLLFCASIQFSRRWAPEVASYDKIEDWIGEIDASGDTQALDQFRAVWQSLKEWYILPNQYRSFQQMEVDYEPYYDLETVMFDYAGSLWNGAMDLKGGERSDLLQERLRVCEEVVRLLPESDPHNLLEWRRMYGQTLVGLEREKEAEACYERLVNDHPDWVWGYVSWGDLYAFRGEERDPARARDI